ncbi:MAG: peptidylprolyl isomerase [Dehalococcoidia bacterium]|nr:peptidylprolyl isomerase [Dehalococcoidia bacterium]
MARHRLLLPLLLALLLPACGIAPTPTPTSMPEFTLSVQYKEAFPMTIDTTKQYVATLRTDKGDIVIELNAKKAPVTVNNFVNLAQRRFYNNSTFHRVLPDFMAQGGDPTGSGSGSPGYTIADEFTDLTHEQGVISMANTGQPHTGGSQFFITYIPTPWLDGKHTVFGKVTKGMDVVKALTPRDPNRNPTFPGSKLLEVTIQES